MTGSSKIKGLILAFFAMICASAVFVLAHQGMKMSTLPAFFIIWYTASFISFLLYSTGSQDIMPWKVNRKYIPRITLYLALELISAILFFTALKYLTPPVAAFTSQSYIIFVIILGVILLHDRFTGWEIFSGVMIIAGILMISYSSEIYQLKGVLLMSIANVTWSLSNILTKTLVDVENPKRLAFIRSIVFLPFGFIIMLFTGTGLVMPTLAGVAVVAVGGIVGAFLHIIARYSAMKHLEISKLTLITAQYPLVVLLFSYVIYRELPDTHKLIGGAVAVSGSLIFVTIQGNFIKRFKVIKKTAS